MKEVFIVTGASSGIGKSLSLKLIKEGKSVLGLGRNLSVLAEFKKYFPDKFNFYILDLSLKDKIQVFAEYVAQRYKIKSLVCSAGKGEPISLEEVTPEILKYYSAVNFEGPFFLIQSLIPSFLTSSRVIFLSTGLAHTSKLGLLPYCVTKSALYMLSECLKHELRKYHIYITSVRPGAVDTPMQEKLRKNEKHLLEKPRKKQDLFEPYAVAEFLYWLLSDPSNDEFSKKEWGFYEDWVKRITKI